MRGERFNIERVERGSADPVLVALLVLIIGIGLATLFSASYYYGGKRFNDPYFFVGRQALFLAAGAVLAAVAARLPRSLVVKFIPHLFFVNLLLLGATYVPGIGETIMGANRWIIIGGISFQPSEFAKLTLVLYLSYILAKKNNELDDVINSLVPPLLIVGVFTALIYFQNDFSTALFVLLLSLLIFFVAGVKFRYFALLVLTLAPLATILILSKEHRVKRLIAFLDPNSDPIGTGYQVIAAKTALGNGNFWGTGFGDGTEKLGGLPEAHSDFIFAVFAEEAGFLGVLFIIALFLAVAVRGYAIALRVEKEDVFAFLLAFSLTSCIVYQALVNMAVVSGMLPATGLPLPFFSHGGSSMVVALVMSGLLLNISRSVPQQSGGYEYE
ncbi:MAG: putative lipid II flippase FtsW [Spirochaetaceae bacterium]